jgi:hypothetical protein
MAESEVNLSKTYDVIDLGLNGQARAQAAQR